MKEWSIGNNALSLSAFSENFNHRGCHHKESRKPQHEVLPTGRE
jgi:hypothetical protein